MTAFGLTTWAVNRVGWAFGYNQYYNPYYTGSVVVDNSVYNYSQPIVMTPDETTLANDPNDLPPPSEAPDESLSSFDQARQQFYDGDYDAALQSTDDALKELPNDTVIHEFRALVLFAQGKYADAAATLYPVLSVGPGWDWTTLSGLYPSVDTYTQQLRALESYRDAHPDEAAARFVLAYQYLTAGHDDAAAGQLKALLKIQPDDQLAAQLLTELDPEAELPDPPKKVEPPKPSSPITSDQITGNWTAKRGDSSFEMDLDQDGTFAWSFTSGGDTQKVTGVWSIDDDGVLAMEMNDEGVMLAQLDLNGQTMDFYMLGDTSGSDPLQFSKQ
ncbi:MAG: hypothetical protein DWQ34_12795 [Planctomycetota bacterium]|nr:MAG: hypothetical protein DWQ34_12795 [Planctomycetota bacterium]REK24105.1 MAG: hypothetical protein DWQ41_13725 [Planctomycetota bacterium]REK38317.1 MAG: hypothetical protein DWQ45_04920 [Planctomycetota bacterium]